MKFGQLIRLNYTTNYNIYSKKKLIEYWITPHSANHQFLVKYFDVFLACIPFLCMVLNTAQIQLKTLIVFRFTNTIRVCMSNYIHSIFIFDYSVLKWNYFLPYSYLHRSLPFWHRRILFDTLLV